MATPIIMLALMTGPYALSRLLPVVSSRRIDPRDAAAVGLTLLFVFTGTGHFVQTESMGQMLPPWVPERVLLVYLTGILEFAIAAGFLVRRSRRVTGWIAAALLVLFLPVNVYAAIHRVAMGGHVWGPAYLLVRAPLQVAMVLWVYWFTLRQPSHHLKVASGGGADMSIEQGAAA